MDSAGLGLKGVARAGDKRGVVGTESPAGAGVVGMEPAESAGVVGTESPEGAGVAGMEPAESVAGVGGQLPGGNIASALAGMAALSPSRSAIF